MLWRICLVYRRPGPGALTHVGRRDLRAPTSRSARSRNAPGAPSVIGHGDEGIGRFHCPAQFLRDLLAGRAWASVAATQGRVHGGCWNRQTRPGPFSAELHGGGGPRTDRDADSPEYPPGAQAELLRSATSFVPPPHAPRESLRSSEGGARVRRSCGGRRGAGPRGAFPSPTRSKPGR